MSNKKIILEVDINGGVFDANGLLIGSMIGVVGFEPEAAQVEVATSCKLVDLKRAGFSASEIVEMSKQGLV